MSGPTADVEANLDAARRFFGARVRSFRDQAGFASSKALAAAGQGKPSESTIDNICRGAVWPLRETVESIVRVAVATERVTGDDAASLLDLYEQGCHYVKEHYPATYGERWPAVDADRRRPALDGAGQPQPTEPDASPMAVDAASDGPSGAPLGAEGTTDASDPRAAADDHDRQASVTRHDARSDDSSTPFVAAASPRPPLRNGEGAAGEGLEPDSPTRQWWRRWPAVVVGIVLAAAIVIVIVWAHTDDPKPPPDTSGAAGPVTASNPAAPGATFTFDALGSTASQYINVYAGPGPSTNDRTETGSFKSGQQETAVCQASGRTIRSDPTAGEQSRSSDRWVRLNSPDGQIWFATLTYGTIDDQALDALPSC